MKKYLLTALLGVFGLFGAFASAESFTFIGQEPSSSNNYQYYSPSSFTPNVDISFTDESDNISYDCDEGRSCSLDFEICVAENECELICTVYSDESFDCDLESGITYHVYRSESSYFNSFTLTVDDYAGESGGSGNPDFYPVGGILSGGNDSLKPIIDGLDSAITEFIPYLVYLGLGIITVIIGFVAIRWLVNRTQAKVRGTFSSGRRRK